MTVDKPIADALIASQGIFPGDEHLPPIALIIEYDNAWGGVSYGCIRQGTKNTYAPSPYIGNPRIYWSLSSAATDGSEQ